MPKIGSRVFGYAANGAIRFEGVYRGKKKVGSGYTARVYKIIVLDDGNVYETVLPVKVVA